MYETSLHTLQPDQGLNQKQSTRRSFPKKRRIIPSLWGKNIRVSCSTWPSMKLIMLTNTQISTIIGILILIFMTEPKDESATSFKHYSYHAQWHKDEHENRLASPSKVWNISLYLVVNTLDVIWVCVVEPGILGKVKSGILNIIVLRRIIDQN